MRRCAGLLDLEPLQDELGRQGPLDLDLTIQIDGGELHWLVGCGVVDLVVRGGGCGLARRGKQGAVAAAREWRARAMFSPN